VIGSFVHDKWTFEFDKSQKIVWLTEHTVCFSRKLFTEVSEYLSEVLYSDALFDIFIDGVSEYCNYEPQPDTGIPSDAFSSNTPLRGIR
jgi:hypothetical protein